jgi:hypothetical protein
MPDELLTVAELERLLAAAELLPPAFHSSWRDHEFARVCRHALTLEAEVARLRRQIAAQRHEVHDDDGDAT